MGTRRGHEPRKRKPRSDKKRKNPATLDSVIRPKGKDIKRVPPDAQPKQHKAVPPPSPIIQPLKKRGQSDRRMPNG